MVLIIDILNIMTFQIGLFVPIKDTPFFSTPD